MRQITDSMVTRWISLSQHGMAPNTLHHLVTVLVLCNIIVHGLTITRKVDDWPIEDCQGMNIDLIMIADAATTIHGLSDGEHYKRQMHFFSQMVDIFTGPAEVNTTRLRVSVIASTINTTTDEPHADIRILFDDYDNITSLKLAIENDSIDTSVKSFPLSIMISIMTRVIKKPWFGARGDAVQVIVMVVDGGKPFQITKVDSETMGIFNTTEIKIMFILIGREAAMNMRTAFPRNNYVLVKSTESLVEKQMIPVQLCKKCFPGWFRYLRPEPHIGITRASCYKLITQSEELSWLDASETCRALSSSLVAIETRAELTYLHRVMSRMIKSYQREANDTSDYINVYIGLMRRSSSLGRRFIWQNNMPLVHTHWGEGQPNSGTIHLCVVWNFSIINMEAAPVSVNMTLGDNTNTQSYRDFWASVGCGFLNNHVFLCESETKLYTQRANVQRVKLEPPKELSVKSAVERGELAYFGENSSLVAVSALRITKANPVDRYTVFVSHHIDQPVPLPPLHLYECGDISQTRIPFSSVCDHRTQCQNTLDETVCQYRECDTRTEFRCHSGQCITEEQRCDLHPDCLDGSDEEECMTCQHKRCSDGRCLPVHWFADGEVDCSSCVNQGSIEGELETAGIYDANQCLFTCNRTECVSRSMLYNGHVDCSGPEGDIDERLGALESTLCYQDSDLPPANFSNWAPKCVYIKDRYDETLGCRDMKHLNDCEDFICPDGYFKCPMSYCIPSHYVQNSVYDCRHGEDELDVSLDCPGYFICATTGTCLHPDLVCDRQQHCPEGDDELNCHVTCRDGFLCLGGCVTVGGYDKTIPLTDFTFVDPRTRYLDVSGINVSAVFPLFPRGRFYNLIRASLSGCSITFLNAAPATQNELRALQWIDLSYNLIQTVPVTNIFRYMVGLRSLSLSHNSLLTTLHPDAFNTYSNISAVELLDLSYTSITDIPPALFLPLRKLEQLNLRNTPLVDIRRDMFPPRFALLELDLRQIQVKNVYENMFKNVIIRNKLYTSTFKLCCPQLHNEITSVDACDSPRDPFSSCSDLISVVILRLLLWINGFLAITGNIIVIIYRLFIDRKILRMAYGHFVIHLSFSDLFMGIYLIIIAIADATYRGTYVWDEMKWKNSVACKIAGFLSTLSSETSTLFIALITLDRFLVIRYPFGQMKIAGRVITICCVMNWSLGVLLALVPLLPPLQHWTVYNSNGMCLGLPLTNRRQAGWQFSTAIFIFLNFFLFILIAIGQLAIYRTMSEMRISEKSLTNVSSRRSQDLAVAKHLSLIAITDFLCWFPVGVMGMLALDGTEIGMDAYAWSAVLVLPVNSAMNPLLYTIPTVTQRWRRCKDEMTCHEPKTTD